jgi:ADP-heptose:LPS heptosyltransferase
MKILVIQQKMIGDVLISSIICENLRKEYPEAQIDYLINTFTQPVVENHPSIDNFILFEDKYRKSLVSLFQFLLKIRKQKYDIVIDAYAKIESGLITFFSGAPKRIGYKGKGIQFAYNHKVDYPEKAISQAGLAIERRVELLKTVIHKNQIEINPKIFLTEEEKKQSLDLFYLNQLYPETENCIMISVLGSEKSKTYPLGYMAQLVDQVSLHTNATFLLNYTPKQTEDVEEFLNYCSEKVKQRIKKNLIGKDLRSFMGIMNQCKLIIGNDGGAVNIAKALNKPSFTIFSPWIQKESWSIFEDGINHKAVHLKDYLPDFDTHESKKNVKENTGTYYSQFKPEYFLKDLIEFTQSHLK